jgi:hypothetical protein
VKVLLFHEEEEEEVVVVVVAIGYLVSLVDIRMQGFSVFQD